MSTPEERPDISKRGRVMMASPVVGPLIKQFLKGRLEVMDARKQLLESTIAHVEAVAWMDEFEADAVAAMLAMFPDAPSGEVLPGRCVLNKPASSLNHGEPET